MKNQLFLILHVQKKKQGNFCKEKKQKKMNSKIE